MMLFIEKSYKVSGSITTHRDIYLLPDSIPDEKTFYSLSNETHIWLHGALGADEGLVKEVRVGDLKVYLRASETMKERGMNILNVGDHFNIIDYRFL